MTADRQHPSSASEAGASGDDEAHTRAMRARVCPFCGSSDVEPMALFGSQLMTQQYYCRACHTPFERVKDER